MQASAKQTLPSERIVVSAPMSFSGSARRVWKITPASNPWAHGALISVATLLIICVWLIVLAWYVAFGLLLVPYRIVRRGSRKRKRDELRHRETLDAIRGR